MHNDVIPIYVLPTRYHSPWNDWLPFNVPVDSLIVKVERTLLSYCYYINIKDSMNF